MFGGVLLILVILVFLFLIHMVTYYEGMVDYGRDTVYRNYHRGTLAKIYDAGWEREKRKQIVLRENIERHKEEK